MIYVPLISKNESLKRGNARLQNNILNYRYSIKKNIYLDKYGITDTKIRFKKIFNKALFSIPRIHSRTILHIFTYG